MNLREEILKEHSKRQALKIAHWIGGDASRFKALVTLFLHDEYRVAQRSAWIISHCADARPKLIFPWLKEMLNKTKDPEAHDAVKRNVLRILSRIEIPKNHLGQVMATCFDELADPGNRVAVKVHAMKTLVKIAKIEPEIKGELKATIEAMLLHDTPALQACARNALKKLSK